MKRSVVVDAAQGGIEVLLAALVVTVVVLWWPWVVLTGLVAASVVGAGLALLGFRVVAPRTRLRRIVGKHAPASWIHGGRSTATLAVSSESLRAALVQQGQATEARRTAGVVIGLGEAAGLVVCVVLVPWVALHLAFAEVRVVHVAPGPLELFVEGRSLGVVLGVSGEDPAAVREVRVPRGVRTFEARSLDGSVVDRTVGLVGEGAAQLYVPYRGEQCFWVEQRFYGRVGRVGERVLPLRGGGSLITLDDPVDSWFEPNPEPGSDRRWFSGGTRTAVRHGPCASMPGHGG